jgi:hypothetical protein
MGGKRMKDLKAYYNDNGQIVSASTDLASKQFYSDYLLVDGLKDVIGNVGERESVGYMLKAKFFASSLASTDFTEGGVVWKDESGNSVDLNLHWDVNNDVSLF